MHEGSKESDEGVLNDLLASLFIFFLLAAKSLRKTSPKVHKRHEPNSSGSGGGPGKLQTPQFAPSGGGDGGPEQTESTLTALLGGLIAIILYIVVGSSTRPIRSTKQKSVKQGGVEKETDILVHPPPIPKQIPAAKPLPSTVLLPTSIRSTSLKKSRKGGITREGTMREEEAGVRGNRKASIQKRPEQIPRVF